MLSLILRRARNFLQKTEWNVLVVCISSLQWFPLIFWGIAWIAHHQSKRIPSRAKHLPLAVLVLGQYPLWQLVTMLSDTFSQRKVVDITDLTLSLCALLFYTWFEESRKRLQGGSWSLLLEVVTLSGFGVCFYRVLYILIG